MSAARKDSVLRSCIAFYFCLYAITPLFYHVSEDQANVSSAKLQGHLHIIYTDMANKLLARGKQHRETCSAVILEIKRGIIRADIIADAHAIFTGRHYFNLHQKSGADISLLSCKSFVSSLLLRPTRWQKASPFESFCFKADSSPPCSGSFS